MDPDGTDKRKVTSGGSTSKPFRHPRWSPDGTMLVFDTADDSYVMESQSNVYLLRKGRLTKLQLPRDCSAATSPAFSVKGDRILFYCYPSASYLNAYQTMKTPAVRAPAVGSVGLDGSGWRPIIYHIPTGQTDQPAVGVGTNLGIPVGIDVSPSDGAILIRLLPFQSVMDNGRIALASSGGSNLRVLPDLGGGENSAWRGRFAANGVDIVVSQCQKVCNDRDRTDFVYAFVRVNRSGVTTKKLLTLPASSLADLPTGSPGGTYLTYSLHPRGQSRSTMYVADLSKGSQKTVGAGRDPAWQPKAVPLPSS